MILFIVTLIIYFIVTAVMHWSALLTNEIFWKLLVAFILTYIAVKVITVALQCIFACLSRLSFYKKLKRYAEENGYQFTQLHHPLRAFFKVYAGADIILDGYRRHIPIKFFPHFIRGKIVHIVSRDKVSFSKPWGLVVPRPTARFVHKSALYDELAGYCKKIDLSPSEEGETTVVVISPSCYKMTCVSDNRKDVVDNGYEWGDDLVFWYQKAFFKFLEQ